MCWSGEASTALASLGFIGALLEFRKTMRPSDIGSGSHWQVEGFSGAYALRGLALFYFSLMEALQAVNYMYLNQPGPMNSLCALLGYVHISFQPFFFSWFSLSFVPRQRRQYWFKYVNIISGVASFMMLMTLMINPSLPGCFAKPCLPKESMPAIFLGGGGTKLGCSMGDFRSYFGDWHIAWQWALNQCGWLSMGYSFVSFVLPLFYGAWRVMLYTIIFGPVLAFTLTGNPDEWAAIWCLLSIAFLSGVKIPWIRNLLTCQYESWRAYFSRKG